MENDTKTPSRKETPKEKKPRSGKETSKEKKPRSRKEASKGKKPRSRKEAPKEKPEYITQSTVMSEYGLTRNQIDLYLPEPVLRTNPHYSSAAKMRLFDRNAVEKIIAATPALRKKVWKKEKKKRELRQRASNAEDYLNRFSPFDLLEQGSALNRRFHLHVGPTNSGKTYSALSALKASSSGVYLGPLRLLALEVYETLNSDGIPCSLLTGEEYIQTQDAPFTASTIELSDFTQHYDVAVIDEAQMLSDPFRGQHWLEAICLINAADVHICLAPEAQMLVENILTRLGAPFDVEVHERLVPLVFRGTFRDFKDAKSGDAFIMFSRKGVLQLAAVLEQQGFRASVIYGALPPASRREEVRRFEAKETSVVVATDAIGMGISLPIRRIIFVEVEKYDGKVSRMLNPTEIKQIAGRAGRYGKYDLGEVLTMSRSRVIAEALKKPVEPITKLVLGFPQDALSYDYPLADLLKIWDGLEDDEIFSRADMSDAEFLLTALGKSGYAQDKPLVYSLVTCPVDTKNERLVAYWAECSRAILRRDPVRRPSFPTETLADCELQYKAYDVYHQLMRRIGIEDDCIEEKAVLSKKINDFLKKEKSGFLSHCRICKKPLPVTSRYRICEECYEKMQWYERDFYF